METALAATGTSNLPKGRSRATDMQHTGWVIDPRMTRNMARWDLLMVGALVFTALVTPVEVVFLHEGAHINALWIINRIVDFLFLIDMLITFNLAYQETAEHGGHWVINKKVIIVQYLKGWVRAHARATAVAVPSVVSDSTHGGSPIPG